LKLVLSQLAGTVDKPNQKKRVIHESYSLKKQAIQINIFEIITLVLATGENVVAVTNKMIL
jgi:hypothetical protein